MDDLINLVLFDPCVIHLEAPPLLSPPSLSRHDLAKHPDNNEGQMKCQLPEHLNGLEIARSPNSKFATVKENYPAIPSNEKFPQKDTVWRQVELFARMEMNRINWRARFLIALKKRRGSSLVGRNVNAKEQKLYGLELDLIKKHFKGLKPRAVKLVKKLELGAHGEAGEPDLLIRDARRTREELEALLKHELIHYELKDKGNVYHGHGEAFLKRAQELGIVDNYVLQRCFSAEEYEHTPTVRKTRKIPLTKFTLEVDKWFEVLFEEVAKLPIQQKIRIYPHVQNVYVGWEAFSAAVKARKDHILHEIWKIKKGPRGKELHELQKEYALLQAQHAALSRKFKKRSTRYKGQSVHRDERCLALDVSSGKYCFG